MKTMLVANWKMNPVTLSDAYALFDATRKSAEKNKNLSVVVAPPTLFINALRTRYKGKKVQFGAQHARGEEGGSHTGDISLRQVKGIGCQYVIIGHAERRALGETDDEVRAKVSAALMLGLIPIVCIGEKTRGSHGEHFDVVRAQLKSVFMDVPTPKVNKVIVAYEPVWAIGAPAPMQPRDMHEMSIFIRKVITECYETELKVPRVIPTVLYGGAVDSTNVHEMQTLGEVAGFLVGRASTTPDSIRVLIQALT